jgi:hypothetical protein
LKSEFFKKFWFCALFGPFPTFFDFSNIFEKLKFSKLFEILKKLKVAAIGMKLEEN